MKEKQLLSIEDILIKAAKERSEFISTLKEEDELDKEMSKEDLHKDVLYNENKTETYKNNLISEIRSGLGDEIIRSVQPNDVIEEKRNIFKRFFDLFR